MDHPRLFPVRARHDVERARREARAFGRQLGFGAVATEELVLAVSELAVNLLRYAVDGSLSLSRTARETPAGGHVEGIRVVSRDAGPGIANLVRAMEDGYSTGGGLGSGLPATRRLMTDFEIRWSPAGTIVTACKWPA